MSVLKVSSEPAKKWVVVEYIVLSVLPDGLDLEARVADERQAKSLMKALSTGGAGPTITWCRREEQSVGL